MEDDITTDGAMLRTFGAFAKAMLEEYPGATFTLTIRRDDREWRTTARHEVDRLLGAATAKEQR